MSICALTGGYANSYAVSVEYSTYSELFTINITKKAENISINSLDKEFDGTPVEAVVTKLNPNSAEIKWFTEQGGELPSAPSNVGKYYVVVSTTETDTIMAGTKRLDFEITKQTPITPAALVIDSYTYSPTQTLDDIDLGSEYRWKNGSKRLNNVYCIPMYWCDYWYCTSCSYY